MSATGFCLYDWKNTSPEQLLQIADCLLNAFALAPKSVSFAVKTLPDTKGETLHLKRMPWKAFISSQIRSAQDGFSVERSGSVGKPAASLTITYGIFDDLPRISFVTETGSDNIPSELKAVIPQLAALAAPIYGFAFGAQTTFAASGYIRAFNGPNLFKNENQALFQQDYRLNRPGKTYRGQRLRMVYPLNILNDTHLSISIGGGTLKDFISQGPENGKLSPLPGELHLWTVDTLMLQRLNDALGAAGALISWQTSAATKPRLP